MGSNIVKLCVNDLASQRPDLLKEWNYKKNEKAPQEYAVNSGKKVWWLCNKGHEWQAIIQSRTSGRNCPYCSNQKVLQGYNDLSTTYPDLAREWDYDNNGELTPYQIVSGYQKKVWWLCKNGHSYESTVGNRIKGSNCPYCSTPIKKILVGFNDLETIRPDLAREWNYTRNKKLPKDFTVGSDENVWWICTLGHEWNDTISNRNKGRNCPYCSNHRVLTGFNDLETIRPDLAKEWNYQRNKKSPREFTIGNDTKVWWKCKEKHEWQAQINSRTRINGSNCPYCNGSKTERLTYKILKDLTILFVAEKKFEQDVRVKYYPYDVWVSKYGLLIECDGIQHFKEVKYFEQNKPFDERIKTDNIKNQYAFEKRIPLLRIPYTYNPDTEEEKIRQILKEFIETRKIPQEIIEYYEQYDFSNYSQIAKEMNEL